MNDRTFDFCVIERFLPQVGVEEIGADLSLTLKKEISCSRSVSRPWLGYKKLSQEEVEELMPRIWKGDKEAFATLLLCKWYLCASVARQCHYMTNIPIEDLSQQGILSLVKVIKGYNPKKGRFNAYALTSIRAGIITYITECDRTIHLPRHIEMLLAKLSRAENALRSLEIQPTVARLALAIGESEKRTRSLVEIFANRNTPSFDAPFYDSDESDRYDSSRSSGIFLSDDLDPSEILYAKEKQKEIIEAIEQIIRYLKDLVYADQLPSRAYHFFMTLYGLVDGGERATLEKTAKQFGLSGKSSGHREKQIVWKRLQDKRLPLDSEEKLLKCLDALSDLEVITGDALMWET